MSMGTTLLPAKQRIDKDPLPRSRSFRPIAHPIVVGMRSCAIRRSTSD